MTKLSGDRLAQLFHDISVPRLAGSPEVAEAESSIRTALGEAGYVVEDHRFVTNARRLTASSVAGAGVGWTTLALVPMLVLPLPGWAVVLAGAGALLLVGALALGISEGYLRSADPPVQAVNLIVPPAGPGRCWLVAHSDSKSQSVSMRGRILGGAAFAAGVVGIVVLLAARISGPLPGAVVLPTAIAAMTGAGVLSGSRARATSPGAVDNATGVVAAIEAFQELRERRDDAGLLITGAEEFGMEGARAWVRDQGGTVDEVFVNFDGVDDGGRYVLTRHRGVDRRRRALARRLAGALHEELARGDLPVWRIPLPIGRFVDGAVLARAGGAGMTVSSGDWRSLGVVHTPGDVPGRVKLERARECGQVVARAIEHVIG